MMHDELESSISFLSIYFFLFRLFRLLNMKIFSINQLDANKELIPKWPQLLVEVVSVDYWSRYRIEGYGHTALPTDPGYHTLHIDTWRPVTNKPSAEMRRFFIGGTPELEDIRYCGNMDSQGSVQSKMGFQTRASGRVKVKMNVIHQAKAFLLGNTKPGTRKQSRRVLIDRLSSATLFSSVNTVLEAFRWVIFPVIYGILTSLFSGKQGRRW